MKTRSDTDTVVFTCDVTGTVIDTGKTDFDEAWEVAREAGWRAWVDPVEGGPWQHYSQSVTLQPEDPPVEEPQPKLPLRSVARRLMGL